LYHKNDDIIETGSPLSLSFFEKTELIMSQKCVRQHGSGNNRFRDIAADEARKERAKLESTENPHTETHENPNNQPAYSYPWAETIRLKY
jgi:hypothetical protein